MKKHEDFASTMEANEDKIDGTLQSGQRLVDSNNLYSGKIQDKMDSIKDRWVFSGLRRPSSIFMMIFYLNDKRYQWYPSQTLLSLHH